jgi:hypothetical protein
MAGHDPDAVAAAMAAPIVANGLAARLSAGDAGA